MHRFRFCQCWSYEEATDTVGTRCWIFLEERLKDEKNKSSLPLHNIMQHFRFCQCLSYEEATDTAAETRLPLCWNGCWKGSWNVYLNRFLLEWNTELLKNVSLFGSAILLYRELRSFCTLKKKTGFNKECWRQYSLTVKSFWGDNGVSLIMPPRSGGLTISHLVGCFFFFPPVSREKNS